MENVKYKTPKIVRAKEVGLLLYIANILIALKNTNALKFQQELTISMILLSVKRPYRSY